jgi:transposase
MESRHAISDADWERIKDLLPGRPGQTGWVAKDNRLFIDAVLWITKTGAPWRDLPEQFGNWNSVWKRFDRWARKGTWRVVFEVLQDPDLEWLILDSTVIRAHPCAAGAPKKRTVAGAKRNKLWAAVAGGLEPRSIPQSVAWDCPSSWS